MSTIEARVHALVVSDPDDDVAAAARRHALRVAPLLDDASLAELVGRVVDRVNGLGPLQGLLTDASVAEIMVNSRGDVWVERDGRLQRSAIDLEPAAVRHLIERVVAPLGRRADRASPIVDARLADGARVHAVVAPVAIDGACLTIRRFSARSIPLNAFAPPGVVGLLELLVARRANLLVSGPTSSGKTTLLNAIGACLSPAERVITIEDAAELRWPGDHVVRLEARPANPEGAGEITMRDLVRAALRMRPDRLVVGEVRGPEALDMVMAMSTGHDGSMSTCHANSALDALRRVEVMVLQGGCELPLASVRELVHAAIDVVVHVGRGEGGRRRVIEVVEVVEPEDLGGVGRVRALARAETVVAEPRRRGPQPAGHPT